MVLRQGDSLIANLEGTAKEIDMAPPKSSFELRAPLLIWILRNPSSSVSSINPGNARSSTPQLDSLGAANPLHGAFDHAAPALALRLPSRSQQSLLQLQGFSLQTVHDGFLEVLIHFDIDRHRFQRRAAVSQATQYLEYPLSVFTAGKVLDMKSEMLKRWERSQIVNGEKASVEDVVCIIRLSEHLQIDALHSGPLLVGQARDELCERETLSVHDKGIARVGDQSCFIVNLVAGPEKLD